MFYAYGVDYHLENIKQISDIRSDGCSIDEIKLAYNRFLDVDSVFDKKVDWVSPVFVSFSDSIHYSKKYFTEKKEYFDINPPEIEVLLKNGYFSKVFNDLKSDNRCVFDMANMVIKVIIINKLNEYTNGTTEDALGLAVIDYKLFFNEIDFQELIFHQVIHMLIYLDDKIKPHLPDYMKAHLVSSDFVHKAGGNQFPLYILFHSYIVGVEILLYRLNMKHLNFKGNYHGSTLKIIERCRKGQRILDDHLDKFTEHGRQVLLKTYACFTTVTNQYCVEEV